VVFANACQSIHQAFQFILMRFNNFGNVVYVFLKAVNDSSVVIWFLMNETESGNANSLYVSHNINTCDENLQETTVYHIALVCAQTHIKKFTVLKSDSIYITPPAVMLKHNHILKIVTSSSPKLYGSVEIYTISLYSSNKPIYIEFRVINKARNNVNCSGD
jgi:hypothetical protein